MARSLFGSKPKRSMTDPDAFSQGDPSTTEQPSERSYSPWDRRGASSRADSEWPATSERESQHQGWQSASPRFDLQTTEKLEDVSLTNPQVGAVLDEGMIGIALGSPRLVSSHVATPKESSNDQGAPALYNIKDTPRSSSLRRKPSKWKKIGSLFKAKQSIPQSKSPFYQVQMNDEELRDSNFETRLQSEAVLRLDGADVKKGGRREERFQETQSPQEIEPNFPRQHESNGERDAWPITNSRTEQPSDPTGPAPFIHVDIPDIHMERYSVMFGNLLGNDQSSRLLARRSRTLDSLAVPGTNPSMPHRPGLPQRRATSPGRSNGFVTLPSHPKARKYLDSYTLPRGPSPLSKIKAASIASSPEKLSLGDKESVYLAVTPSLDASQISDVDASLNSATSVGARSDAGIDAAIMLKRRPTKSYVNVKEEPAWEMVTKKEDSSSQQQGMPTRPAVQPTPPPTPPKSISNSPSMIPPFNASPSKVDRIMSPKGTAPMDSPEEPSPERFNDSQMRSDANEAPEIPKISIARTISVSRRPREALVVESGAARSRSAERLVDRVPLVVDVRRGHRHEKSQLAEIETA